MLIIIATFISITANSQILITLLLGDKLNSDGLEFGLEGGNNWSNISGFETNKPLSTFNMGFYFDIRVKNQWSIYTGVLVKSNMGVSKFSNNDLINLNATMYKDTNSVNLTGDYRQKINYFIIPVLLKYKFKNHMYIMGGPQFSIMHKSWIEYNSDFEGRDATIKEYNTDNIKRLDAGVSVGTGIKLMHGTGWTIGARYYYGFVDTYKNISGTKNSSIFVELFIPIGAEKKPESK